MKGYIDSIENNVYRIDPDHTADNISEDSVKDVLDFSEIIDDFIGIIKTKYYYLNITDLSVSLKIKR